VGVQNGSLAVLDVDEGFFDKKVDRSIGTMRLKYYPAQAVVPRPGQLRASAHTDYGGASPSLVARTSPGGFKCGPGPGTGSTSTQARQLRMMMHACVDQLSGGSSMFIDENDHPSTCRLARVGESLVVVDFAGDPSKGRFRQIDLFMVEADGPSFRLDPKHRLASFRAKHFALPADRLASSDRSPAGAVVRARHGADARSAPAGDGPGRSAGTLMPREYIASVGFADVVDGVLGPLLDFFRRQTR
jgi:hypothetical protein